jgi:methyltransferase (TIGR00027 family)
VQDKPSVTARMTRYFRTYELSQPPHARLLDDTVAPSFHSPRLDRQLNWLMRFSPEAAPLQTFIVARHRYIEDVLAATAPHRQVLLLGAGYDSRALRHRALAEAWYEVDHPATQSAKRRAIERAPELHPWPATFVPVDFRTDDLFDRLRAAGFRPELPTFVSWEGVTMYLHEDAVRGTLQRLSTELTGGATLCLDWCTELRSPNPLRRLQTRLGKRLLSTLGEPLDFELPLDRFTPWLHGTGWTARELVAGEDLPGRYLSAPRRSLDGMALATLVTTP